MAISHLNLLIKHQQIAYYMEKRIESRKKYIVGDIQWGINATFAN